MSTQKIMTSQLVYPLLLWILEVFRNYSSCNMPDLKVLYKTKLSIRPKLNTYVCATFMRNYYVIAFIEICIDFLDAATRKLYKYAPLQTCMP